MVVTTADDYPTGFRIVNCKVSRSRLGTRRRLGRAPGSRLQIKNPGVSKIVTLGIATEEHELLVLCVAYQAGIHSRRRLSFQSQGQPAVLLKAIQPSAGVSRDSPIRSLLSHVSAAKEDNLIVQWVVSQRTCHHGRWRLGRPQICPAPLLNVVGGRQAACEVDQRIGGRMISHLVENDVEIGPGNAFPVSGGSSQNSPLAAGGDARVGARHVGQRQLLLPGCCPLGGKLALPLLCRPDRMPRHRIPGCA